MMEKSPLSLVQSLEVKPMGVKGSLFGNSPVDGSQIHVYNILKSRQNIILGLLPFS
jgi:hypothetical protein